MDFVLGPGELAWEISTPYWRDADGDVGYRSNRLVIPVVVEENRIAFEERLADAITHCDVVRLTQEQWDAAFELEDFSDAAALAGDDFEAFMHGVGRGCELRELKVDPRRRTLTGFYTRPGLMIGKGGWNIKRRQKLASAFGWRVVVKEYTGGG